MGVGSLGWGIWGTFPIFGKEGEGEGNRAGAPLGAFLSGRRQTEGVLWPHFEILV